MNALTNNYTNQATNLPQSIPMKIDSVLPIYIAQTAYPSGEAYILTSRKGTLLLNNGDLY